MMMEAFLLENAKGRHRTRSAESNEPISFMHRTMKNLSHLPPWSPVANPIPRCPGILESLISHFFTPI